MVCKSFWLFDYIWWYRIPGSCSITGDLHYGIRNKIKCLLGMNYKVVHEPRIVSTTTRNRVTDHFNPALSWDSLVLDI